MNRRRTHTHVKRTIIHVIICSNAYTQITLQQLPKTSITVCFDFFRTLFIIEFNQRELRLIRARPYSSLLTVTHMSHRFKLNSNFFGRLQVTRFKHTHTRVHTHTYIYTSEEREKNQTVHSFLDLIAGFSLKRVLLATNRSGQMEIKIKKCTRIIYD